MKRINFALIMICFLLNANAQRDNRVVIGTVDSIYSKLLKENRKIWIHLPKSYASNFKFQKYPVIYLLDGDTNFHSVTGLIPQLSVETGSPLWPEMIVVGIPNTNRTRDLTPTHTLKGLDGKEQASLSVTGGGENFT